MNNKQVTDAYRRFERQGLVLEGFRKEVTPNVVRFVSDGESGSFISFFEVPEQDADQLIQQEIAYFTTLGKDFEWKVFSTDEPAGFGEKLVSQGFVKESTESFMVLPLPVSQATETETETEIETEIETETDAVEIEPTRFEPDLALRSEAVSVVEVIDEAGIRAAMSVQEQVFGGNWEDHTAELIATKQKRPDDLKIYVVFDAEMPVSSAWLRFTEGSPFAGLWGGATLDSHRGKGYYSALVKRRIRDAMAKQKQYLTIDASEMSRVIVEKHGFQHVAITSPYLWKPTQE
ncbi:GNAT family N-acetyltransferase [Photobacterium sp. GSS17]|uniref:GNAT family N-acetyltransferase n=1 Tax=Photobacterium sp. GSS17 TaxID=3020715 RepID=UPI002361174E|nr:N-acetyltransferase [Photobacterium sp. GSS17]